MWEYEHSVEAAVDPAAVWRIWAEVERWGGRTGDSEASAIEGPCAGGT